MLSRHHFRLRTLGQLTLASVSGEVEKVEDIRPRHLAVLAVIAYSPRAIPRDKLVEMFWGGETEDRARHSLSNSLSGLRALLGPGGVTSRHDLVGLGDDVRLEIDALQFVSACESHDDEHAASLYAGEFLSGIYVPDAEEFDRWLGRERNRFERMYLEVCERLAPKLLNSARWNEAAGLAHRWLDAAPDSAAAFVTLLRAIAGPGTPAALRSALDEFERVRDSQESRGVRPAPATTTIVAQLREQLILADRDFVEAMPLTIPTADYEVPPRRGVKTRPEKSGAIVVERFSSRPWWQLGIAAAAAALLLLTGILVVRRRPAIAMESARPVVAVTAIDDTHGDTSIAWLRAGLPRLIATNLGSSGGLEIISPSRVRDVVARLAGSSSAHLTDEQSVDVARRLGASWAVTGGLSTANGGYLLDITARSVKNPADFESFSVFASTPLELGGLAASRLETLLGVLPGADEAAGTVRFSGFETNSAEAYRHFIRGTLAMEAEQLGDAARELDAAIALDSGFADAIRSRWSVAGYLGDAGTERKLAELKKKSENRLPEFSRLNDEILNLDTLGESARADALSAVLLRRFPRDPRAHTARANLLTSHGRWADADSVLVRELALDSLAMSAGRGPCTPCEVLWRLSQVRMAEGNRAGAESAARRWVELQPDLASAWRNLSATLAAVGKPAEAVDAGFHVLALARHAPVVVDFGRTMLSARRYDIVDSLLRKWRGSRDPTLVWGERDLRTMLERERGQYSASIQSIGEMPASSGLILLRADALARLGKLSEARKIYEGSGHPPGSSRAGQFTPPEARAFAWAHALEADALIRAGDTVAARSLLDSIQRAGLQSYYDRDKRLHHHVRGMLSFTEGKFSEAERELRAAEWGANGWTRTNIELARAQLAQRHSAAAIETLRDAYMAPLDGMGRYVPRSEIDFWMARAFMSAGQRDSADRYAGYVRSAWQRADPFVRVKLDSLISATVALR